MKISFSVTHALVLAATMASAFDENTGKYGELDTHRAPKFFDPSKARKGGYTYADELSIDVKAEMDSQGISMKGSFDGMGDTEMHVTSQSGGNVKVELSIQNVKADLTSFIMNMHCDSNDQVHSDSDCQELFEAVGSTETMVMDKDGNLMELTTPDGETLNFAALEQQQTLGAKFQANQFVAAHHFDKSQQLLKLIPDHAVRPGDSWIDDIDMGGMGTFKGNSYLKGYADYQGSDCAVFYFEGSLHLDIAQIAQSIGADPATLPSNMADAKITNDILWDYTDGIARWVQVNISTSFDMQNPMNPMDASTVHIPVDVVFALATDITARPDHEEEKGGDSPEPYHAPPAALSTSASESNSKSKSSSGAGGAFAGAFVGLVIVGVAAAGFMYYKRLLSQDAFVRPSYDFSPVGAEPIYNPTPLAANPSALV